MVGRRFFNTADPIRPERQYCIPPLEQIDLAEVSMLVREERYFVLQASRQTGKTSVLLALRDQLNSGAEWDDRCVYANVEAARAMRERLHKGLIDAAIHVSDSRSRFTQQEPQFLKNWG